MVGPSKDPPWCTIFLVCGALTAHILVLIGNLSTAGMIQDLGESSNGWSSVGKSLAGALQSDIEPAMTTVSTALTQTIEVVTQLQQSTDVAMAISGSTIDSALAEFNSTRDDLYTFKANLITQLRGIVDELLRRVQPLVEKFILIIQPALDQIKEWMGSFNAQVQAMFEEFSTTMDRVQKLLDDVMHQTSPTVGEGEDAMVYNTYTLFDTDNSGKLHPDDLQKASLLYGISALSGNKAQELFDKYDADAAGGMDEQEFKLFVNDPSIPGVMTVVLRTYSKDLADIGGRVAAARLRDEVAESVVEYFELVCAKNMTRVAWLAQALTNGSLPIQLTADILKELVDSQEDPSNEPLVDVGLVVIQEMMRMNPDYVVQALRLMSEPAFWKAEGFLGEQQAPTVARVLNWTTMTPQGPGALRSGGFDIGSVSGVRKKQDQFAAQDLVDKADNDAALYESSASQFLRSNLLGGAGAARSGDNPEADAAVKRGQLALPVTLKWAQWLAANATSTAHQHLQEVFDYSGQSSGAMDNIAMQVSGMVSKIQAFSNSMAAYASPQGIERLVNESLSFVKGAADDILYTGEEYVDAQLKEVECQLYPSTCNMTQKEKDMSLDLTGAFHFITVTLRDLKGILPTVIKDLKFAKKGVSTVYNTLDSAMMVLGLKAPPVLYQLSSIYKSLWVAYFVFFAVATLGVLLYGFWASGYFGGPQTADDYEAPRGCMDRLRTCWHGCTACLRGCHDNTFCFWSVLLLAQVVVLLVFLCCVLICVVAGLEAFLTGSCAQVYILGDVSVCTTTLKSIKRFLKSFWSGDLPIDDVCFQENLMTCKLIADQMATGVGMAIAGGVLAAVMSFWMIIESAVMHERAKWGRMLDGEAKKP